MIWNKVKDLQRLLLEEQATLLELEEVLPEVRADLPAHDVPEQPLTPRAILVAPELTPEIHDPIDPSEVERVLPCILRNGQVDRRMASRNRPPRATSPNECRSAAGSPGAMPEVAKQTAA